MQECYEVVMRASVILGDASEKELAADQALFCAQKRFKSA